VLLTNAATVHYRNNDLRRLPVVVDDELGRVTIKPDRTACWGRGDATLCLYITETKPDAWNVEDMCVDRSVLIVHVANASVSTTAHNAQDQIGVYGLLHATYVLRRLQFQR